MKVTPDVITQTIAQSGTDSAGTGLAGVGTLCGLYAAAATTGAITIQVSHDGITWYSVNGVSSVTPTGAAYYPLNPADYVGALFVRVHSGSAEASARTFYLAVRAV